MRTGEVFALSWDDIDFDNRIIKISKTVYAKDKEERGRWYLGTTKTSGSQREVYNYLIYGVTSSFSHFFGAIFYIPIIIFSIPLFIILVIPMKICSCELGYDDFRKKLLGNYHFTEI